MVLVEKAGKKNFNIMASITMFIALITPNNIK